MPESLHSRFRTLPLSLLVVASVVAGSNGSGDEKPSVGHGSGGTVTKEADALPRPASTPEEAFQTFCYTGGTYPSSRVAWLAVVTREHQRRIREMDDLSQRCYVAEQELHELLRMLFGQERQPAFPRMSLVPPKPSRPWRLTNLTIQSKLLETNDRVTLLVQAESQGLPGSPPPLRYEFKAVRESGGWKIVPPPCFDSTLTLEPFRRYVHAVESIVQQLRDGRFQTRSEVRQALTQALVDPDVEPGSPEAAIALLKAGCQAMDIEAVLSVLGGELRSKVTVYLEQCSRLQRASDAYTEALEERFGPSATHHDVRPDHVEQEWQSPLRFYRLDVIERVASTSEEVVFACRNPIQQRKLSSSEHAVMEVTLRKVNGRWKVVAPVDMAAALQPQVVYRTIEPYEQVTREIEAGLYNHVEEVGGRLIRLSSLATERYERNKKSQ